MRFRHALPVSAAFLTATASAQVLPIAPQSTSQTSFEVAAYTQVSPPVDVSFTFSGGLSAQAETVVEYATNKADQQLVVEVDGDIEDLVVRIEAVGEPLVQRIARAGSSGLPLDDDRVVLGGVGQVIASQRVRITVERTASGAGADARAAVVRFALEDS